MCAVGFVARAEGRVGCTCVGGGGAVAAVFKSATMLLDSGWEYARCPAGGNGGLCAVGIADGERVADHAAAPCEAHPAEGVGSYDLEHDVIGLAGGNVCGLRDTVDDIGLEGCGSFAL